MTLQDALQTLLHDPVARYGWREGDDLGLAPEDAAHLRATSADEVERAALMVRAALLNRRSPGCGGLRQAFPQTLAAWQRRRHDPHLDLLLNAFQAHSAYHDYRELPHGGPGLCLEEAFFRFAEDLCIGEPFVRRQEYLTAGNAWLEVSEAADYGHRAASEPRIQSERAQALTNVA